MLVWTSVCCFTRTSRFIGLDAGHSSIFIEDIASKPKCATQLLRREPTHTHTKATSDKTRRSIEIPIAFRTIKYQTNWILTFLQTRYRLILSHTSLPPHLSSRPRRGAFVCSQYKIIDIFMRLKLFAAFMRQPCRELWSSDSESRRHGE